MKEGRFDFDDERRYGGLRPLGELLRDGTAAAAIVLAGWVILEEIGPGTSPFDPFSGLLLAGGTLGLLLLFVVPVTWLHRYMRDRKAEKLAQIRREIERYGPDDRSLTETRAVYAKDYDVLNHQFVRLTLVQNTRVVPVDMSVVGELLIVVALPYVAELTAQPVLSLLGG